MVAVPSDAIVDVLSDVVVVLLGDVAVDVAPYVVGAVLTNFVLLQLLFLLILWQLLLVMI